MAWHNGFQKWLSESQSMENAQKVVDYLYTDKKDWSKESISALIGNMRHESSINPNMYEYGYSWGADRGFGLVQWTPRSKFWNWGSKKGYSESQLRSGNSQLARIDFEVDNNIQWIAKTSNFNGLTFKQFRTNSKKLTVSELTEAFTWGYERPNAQAGAESMPARKAFANKAFKQLNWKKGGGSKPDPDPKPDPKPDPEPEPPKIDFSNVLKFFDTFGKKLTESIEKMLIVNLYDYGKSKTFGNSFLKVDRTFSNTYKIKPTLNFNKIVDDTIKKAKSELDDLLKNIVPDPKPDPEPDPDPKPDPDPPKKDFIFPLHKPYRITQEFKGTAHFGVDFAGKNPGDNVPIYAVADGIVTRSYRSDTYGETVFISHNIDGVKYETVYAHMVEGSRKVSVDDIVKQNQQIGITGNTGASQGVHLHFEFHQPKWNIDKTNAVDPLKYLK